MYIKKHVYSGGALPGQPTATVIVKLGENVIGYADLHDERILYAEIRHPDYNPKGFEVLVGPVNKTTKKFPRELHYKAAQAFVDAIFIINNTNSRAVCK